MTRRPKQAEWDLYRNIGNLIAKNGRAIITIPPTKLRRGFSYTIGNQEKGYPELLTLGSWDVSAGFLLNEFSTLMITVRQKAFDDGEIISLPGVDRAVKMIEAKDPKAKTEYCIQAGRFYDNQDYKVFQILIPDPIGAYPDDPACEKDYQVPVLKSAIIH